MSRRKKSSITLRDHAELATELCRMQDLLTSWMNWGGIVVEPLGKSHRVSRDMEAIIRKLNRVRCDLDSIWCRETPRDSGFPYYSRSARKALAEVTGYRTPSRPNCLPEKFDQREYDLTRAALSAPTTETVQ